MNIYRIAWSICTSKVRRRRRLNSWTSTNWGFRRRPLSRVRWRPVAGPLWTCWTCWTCISSRRRGPATITTIFRRRFPTSCACAAYRVRKRRRRTWALPGDGARPRATYHRSQASNGSDFRASPVDSKHLYELFCPPRIRRFLMGPTRKKIRIETTRRTRSPFK